jgi:hypothetical protein
MFAAIADKLGEEAVPLCDVGDQLCEGLSDCRRLVKRRRRPWEGQCSHCENAGQCVTELKQHMSRLLEALSAVLSQLRAGNFSLQEVREALQGGGKGKGEAAEAEELERLVRGPVEWHVSVGGMKEWHYWALGGAVVVVGGVLLWRHRQTLQEAGRAVRETVRNLYQERLVTPVVNIYKTVRYDDRMFQVAPLGELQRERTVLGRMVADYVGGAEREQIVREVTQSGEISRIMPDYEAAIQHPIRGALFGNMVQLLLIQVQKGKSDVSLSLSAVDRLLQMNELNVQVKKIYIYR